MSSIQELQDLMKDAIAKNDVKSMEAIAAQIVAGKKERAKTEAVRLQKEAEALAGKREELATRIHSLVRSDGTLDGQLKAVKSWGFTYKVDRANPNEPDIVYKTVSLTTAVVKVPRAGGGGGTGKSKDEFGLSLGEIFVKFANNDDRAKLATAETGSRQWQVKVAVKKRALAEGLLPPIK